MARRTKDLQDALTAKTLLIHEVDHRVKNNLQMIGSLLGMQARGVRDPVAAEILRGALQRVESIGNVHRRLYQSNDVSRFDLSAFVRETVRETVKGAGRADVTLSFDMEPLTVDAQQAAPLALLLNELVVNALKHAFPGGRAGRLAIAIHLLGSRLEMVMTDDGVGMPAQPDTTADGFGTRLVRSIVRQMRGEVSWRPASPGTTVILSCPLTSFASLDQSDE